MEKEEFEKYKEEVDKLKYKNIDDKINSLKENVEIQLSSLQKELKIISESLHNSNNSTKELINERFNHFEEAFSIYEHNYDKIINEQKEIRKEFKNIEDKQITCPVNNIEKRVITLEEETKFVRFIQKNPKIVRFIFITIFLLGLIFSTINGSLFIIDNGGTLMTTLFRIFSKIIGIT